MIGLEWSNESYARLFRTDTAAWKLLGLEGQAVYMGILRKLDRAGVMPLNRVEPSEAVAALLGWPIEFCEAGLERLVKRGFLIHNAELDLLVDEHYLDREEMKMSGTLRKREYRERRRLESLGRLRPVDTWERDVDTTSTYGNAVERGGTPRDSLPSLSLPSVPSLPSKEKNGQPVSPQQAAVARVWEIYDTFTAERPAAGVALKWWKLLKSNTEHLAEVLNHCGPRGLLQKGTPYIFSVVEGRSKGRAGPPEAHQKRAPTVQQLQLEDEERMKEERQ